MNADTQSNKKRDKPEDKSMEPAVEPIATGATLAESPADEFHGAAVIDENGTEVPITEEMILTAFERLED
ncbi:MAG: hypothetical protein ACI8QN_000959 [Porticoccaceae bacterium]|jgi:hypothetical protein|tara:strand:- start:102 stop:311 length:210 start_codon:yes stop_codon:yes gene_type:complete